MRDKGGTFSEALLESKDGTLLAPSNEVSIVTNSIIIPNIQYQIIFNFEKCVEY